ncbi:gamma-glutamyltransferase [Elysia marginata]|uniref:Gamma-glutamyltransferase n=1 Tax=Elysia marginata TaxID=1093978 RepID=A0AAV4G6C8_9GAST|nr:gamma-glutamyltransferase [Elysia marginata]
MGHNSAEYIHHVAESLRLALADTLKFCADPEFTCPPLERLLSKDYALQLRNMIHSDSVVPSSTLKASHLDMLADVLLFNIFFFQTFSKNRGWAFSLDPSHRNALAPGKRPYHTIIPAMVTSPDTNELLMSYGIMGGFIQPQGHIQILLNMLEFGLDPQAALDAPRFSIGQGKLRNIYEPHTNLDSISLEEGIPGSVQLKLENLGHNVSLLTGLERSLLGRGQAISRGSSWWRCSNESGGDGAKRVENAKNTDASQEVVYWAANSIAENKHTAVLLSSIGVKPYNILRSLTAPDLPSSKTYANLCQTLQSRYCPKPLEIVERFKFHKRSQETGENIADFIAAIKRLSEHCNFWAFLQTTLRNRFVCGLQDEAIQKRLLQERDLTFEGATNLALAMEMANRDAHDLQSSADKSIHKIGIKTPGTGQTGTPTPRNQSSRPLFPPCLSCRKTNHKLSNCYFKDATCNNVTKRATYKLFANQVKIKTNFTLYSLSVPWHNTKVLYFCIVF